MSDREAPDGRFIVAEISKNWLDRVPLTPGTVGQAFEAVIATNRKRGYRLHSFQLHQLVPAPGLLMETIIAVFEKEENCDPSTVRGPRGGAAGES